MITIVDYGLGNVLAFANSYKRLGIPAAIARTADDLAHATKVILPGVGSFDHAMGLLNRSGMRDALVELATVARVPVLGVCVGMQMLGRSSEEGSEPGLGWIAGSVRKLDSAPAAHLPHMGWNDVKPVAHGGLFAGLESNALFYFLHSYYFRCDSDADVLATSQYGATFACAIKSGNIFGVQFHPEKSHSFGTRLLQNFAVLH
jgi:glutamine amidotransferase